jgi:hypothetical protein
MWTTRLIRNNWQTTPCYNKILSLIPCLWYTRLCIPCCWFCTCIYWEFCSCMLLVWFGADSAMRGSRDRKRRRTQSFCLFARLRFQWYFQIQHKTSFTSIA